MFNLSKKQKSLLVSLVHFQWNREGFRVGPRRKAFCKMHSLNKKKPLLVSLSPFQAWDSTVQQSNYAKVYSTKHFAQCCFGRQVRQFNARQRNTVKQFTHISKFVSRANAAGRRGAHHTLHNPHPEPSTLCPEP